jgi:hypothetical protein
VAAALAAFAQVSSGQFSHDDKCFFQENVVLGPVADRVCLPPGAEGRVIRGREGEADIPLFLVHGVIAALACGKLLRSQWMEDVLRASGGLESLPDLIALPRDEDGGPIIPTSRVTALVEAREAWATALGTLAAVTRSITRGQLVMPRISAPSQQTMLCNHPWWESDEDAKRALGPVMAKWLASGVLEHVAWDDGTPMLLQPCGAVPKGSPPFNRLITDA